MKERQPIGTKMNPEMSFHRVLGRGALAFGVILTSCASPASLPKPILRGDGWEIEQRTPYVYRVTGSPTTRGWSENRKKYFEERGCNIVYVSPYVPGVTGFPNTTDSDKDVVVTTPDCIPELKVIESKDKSS